MSAWSPERTSEACDGGKQFAEIFYQTLDKGRHAMSGLFWEAASLIWNGNGIKGKSEIVSFYEKLPLSDTQLWTVDAHPILDLPGFNGQHTICVICGGRIRFGESSKMFTESFILTAEGDEKKVWKIVSDTFRYYS